MLSVVLAAAVDIEAAGTVAGSSGKSLMKLCMTKSVLSGAGAVKLMVTVSGSSPSKSYWLLLGRIATLSRHWP